MVRGQTLVAVQDAFRLPTPAACKGYDGRARRAWPHSSSMHQIGRRGDFLLPGVWKGFPRRRWVEHKLRRIFTSFAVASTALVPNLLC
ncbi:hypothetical protein LX36DRAFT_452552 [Colletotrichum falcatum]|nr:hypothetical protein LX36DRAFT_452552 [Colletotrichum falcatum]